MATVYLISLLLLTALLLPAQDQRQVRELARGDFDGNGTEETVSFMPLMPSPGVSLKELMKRTDSNGHILPQLPEDIRYDVTFTTKENGKITTVGKITDFSVPFLSMNLAWKRVRNSSIKNTILVWDQRQNIYMIFRENQTKNWVVERQSNQFFKSLTETGWMAGGVIK